MRCLVTGAGGFAGVHLVEYLLSLGEEVIGLVRGEAPALKPLASRLRLEHADLCNSDDVLRVVRDVRPDRIYHLAAFASPNDSLEKTKLVYDTNFGGTLNLLSACKELQLKCRVLSVSSGDIYGHVGEDALPLRETSPIRPTSPYAGSKAAAEMVALQFFLSAGLHVIRVRPFNHTGPGQSNFVCSGFARQIVEVESGLLATITVGNTAVSRDFSDVRDIVQGYHLILETGQPGEVYQLCSGQAVLLEDVLQILRDLATKEIPVQVDRSRFRANDSAVRYGDPSRARALGWQSKYALETTLRDLMSYWRDRVSQPR
jgi:GDP-4-dehydro-6-deoxy-D-mannose reductase